MQYTKQQRKAIAAVFKAARKRVWNGKPGTTPTDKRPVHICDAIIDVTTHDNLKAAIEARRVIMHRLGHYDYVEGWLFERGCVPHWTERDGDCKQRIQQWRKEWLRRLEKEFSS